MSIQLQANITSITAKVDGSLGLRVITPELSSEEKVLVMSLQNKNITATFVPIDDAPTEQITIKTDIASKRPSQRLRAVLFILWKQTGEKETFENYYNQTMEKLIELYKSKIED